MIWQMLLHWSLKCQELYHKEEEKSYFVVITNVKNQENTEKVVITPALSESCAHPGAKLAAHSDTVLGTSKRHCISHLRKSKCHSGYCLSLHNSSSFSTIKKNVTSDPNLCLYLEPGELPWILAVLSYHEDISLNKSN